MLRPRSARWFEVLCPRSESVWLAAALARTGAVEIDMRAAHQNELRLQELSEGLNRYRALLPRYGRYWRQGELLRTHHNGAPLAIMTGALARIEQWRRQADPLIEQLQEAEDERYRIRRCAQVMQVLGDSDLNFARLGAIGPVMGYSAALLPGDVKLTPADEQTVVLHAPLPGETYALAVGPAQQTPHIEAQIKALGGRLLRPPDFLHGKPAEAKQQIEQRLSELDEQIDRLHATLERLHAQAELPRVLGELNCLQWFTSQIGVLELVSERFALVSGWTDDLDGDALMNALEAENIPALIHFPPPPPGAEAPQLLDNPRWAKPFEVFARAFGMPGKAEADPSPLLALIAPLLFGYMFGDVGQGFVLLAAGVWLRKRWSLSWLLISGGASAMFFGLLFGSVFSIEHLIPALWLHPLSQPLQVLAAPLIFAICLLSLGQLLNALEAHWQGLLSHWLWTDAGFLLLYLGAVLFIFEAAPYWLPLLGLAWYLLGSALSGGLVQTLSAFGALLERGLQIAVNTLSFARVGAFALAHAGLSSALLSLADVASSALGKTLVLVLGNLLILALEGLVVSIQTTRLILFEFFNRFLRGSGRVFHPIAPPPSILRGES